jgi:hypothetical protein
MPWINLRPANSGGGRKPTEPTAKLYESGQLTISHATCGMLGYPPKIRVRFDPDTQRIELMPTTPTDQGGFSLSGGGNSPHRIGAKAMANKHPVMIGEYRAQKIAGGVELRKIED